MKSDKNVWVVVFVLALISGFLIFEKINRKPKVEVWTEPPLTEVTPPQENKDDGYIYENADLGIKFVYPAGFLPIECESEEEMVCMNEAGRSNRLSGRPDIVLRKIEMENPKDFEKVMMDDVVFDPSGLKPENFSEFIPTMVESVPVYKIRIGLFEGILATNYYVVRNSYILVFEVTSSPVDWTSSGYDPEQDELNEKVLRVMGGMEIR